MARTDSTDRQNNESPWFKAEVVSFNPKKHCGTLDVFVGAKPIEALVLAKTLRAGKIRGRMVPHRTFDVLVKEEPSIQNDKLIWIAYQIRPRQKKPHIERGRAPKIRPNY